MITAKECEIWKGTRFTPWVKWNRVVPKYKIIVFDLDETIGCFGELFILWAGIRHIESSFQKFNELLDLYPEFFRHGILSILCFLQSLKEGNKIHSLMVYTNNQCGPEWLSFLMDYIDFKCEKKIFDQYIGAYDKKMDQKRSTHKKTYSDFIQFLSLPPEEVEICFIDDRIHPFMKQSLVYYISPRPYLHSLSWNNIIHRFLDQKWFSSSSLLSNVSFWRYWKSLHHKNHYTPKNMYMDILVSQKIVAHVKEFIQWGNIKSHREYKKKTLKKKTNLRRTRRLLRK